MNNISNINNISNEYKLVIGVLPHEIEPSLYSENQLLYTKDNSNDFYDLLENKI